MNKTLRISNSNKINEKTVEIANHKETSLDTNFFQQHEISTLTEIQKLSKPERDNLQHSISLIWFCGGRFSNNLPSKYMDTLKTLLNNLKDNLKDNIKDNIKISLLLDHATFLKNQKEFIELANEYNNRFEINFVEDLSFSDKELNKMHNDFKLQAIAGNPALASDFYRLAMNKADQIYNETLKNNIYLDFDDLHNMVSFAKESENFITEIEKLTNKTHNDNIKDIAIIHHSQNISSGATNSRLYFNRESKNLTQAILHHTRGYDREINKNYLLQKRFASKGNLPMSNDLEIIENGPGSFNHYTKEQIIESSYESVSEQTWTSTHSSKLLDGLNQNLTHELGNYESLNVLYSYAKYVNENSLKSDIFENNNRFNNFLLRIFKPEKSLNTIKTNLINGIVSAINDLKFENYDNLIKTLTNIKDIIQEDIKPENKSETIQNDTGQKIVSLLNRKLNKNTQPHEINNEINEKHEDDPWDKLFPI